jgi:hypothetical protein
VKLDPADIAELRPLIDAAVRSTVAQIEVADAKLANRLAFPELEAAALLGIPGHVLGDARRRGEISARKIGKKYVYSRAALVAFLGDIQ